MTPEEIMGGLAVLEEDPHKIWALVLKCYGNDFFDDPVIAKYGHLFSDKQEEKYKAEILNIKEELSKYVKVLKDTLGSQIHELKL